MRYWFYLIACTPLLFWGCTSTLTAFRGSPAPSESILEELRTEIADLRHEIQSKDIEIKLLEEKVDSRNEAGAHHLEGQILTLVRKLAALEKTHEKLAADIRLLTEHANQTSSSLGMYRDKIEELDGRTAQRSSGASTHKSYRVKSGDSLEKIARRHKISLEKLKQANQLSSDRITIGQDLQIPENE